MDILVVSNIIKNFTETLLVSRCKQYNRKFLNDPFNIDLTLLYTDNEQIGGASKAPTTDNLRTNDMVATLANPGAVATAARAGPEDLNPEAAAASELEATQDELREAVVSGTDESSESSLQKLFRVLAKFLIYPLLFIFLIIFPYIYTTYASFSKLINGYRENVMTM